MGSMPPSESTVCLAQRNEMRPRYGSSEREFKTDSFGWD